MNQVKDPKTIVTPFAFSIAPSVLYTPLASPTKRGLAMLVDALLIAVLAEQAGGLFILLVGLTLLIERKSHQIGRVLKWFLYFSMLIMTIYVTSDNIIDYNRSASVDDENSISVKKGEDASEVLAMLPSILAISFCEEFSCKEQKLMVLVDKLNLASISMAEKREILTGVVTDLSLSADERLRLMAIIDETFGPVAGMPVDEPSVDVTQDINDGSAMVDTADKLTSAAAQSTESDIDKKMIADEESVDNSAPKYSLLEWAKGILNDLGLGFGWAAFYFTVFTAWFDGQTLGKKLLNIRVIQLDASTISLWDAFGRYGGYGAGFATGLLGFIQIYWDANRQAIQDKISATVVIDLSKPKQSPADISTNVQVGEH